jgi:hypothetical protein
MIEFCNLYSVVAVIEVDTSSFTLLNFICGVWIVCSVPGTEPYGTVTLTAQ